MAMFGVQTRRSFGGRGSLIACGVMTAAAASAVASAAPALAVANYCIPHPTAEGCNILPRTGPHITAAGISHGRLHLQLTFHKGGQFVAHLKRNPPPNPRTNDGPHFVQPVKPALTLSQRNGGPLCHFEIRLPLVRIGWSASNQDMGSAVYRPARACPASLH